MNCFACQTAERFPLTKLRGSPSCQGCEARALALEFAGKPKAEIDAAMHGAWETRRSFEAGRLKFWSWARQIEEAKTNQTTAKAKEQT